MNIFFIGIGGCSMSAIAEIYLKLGHNIYGSDRAPSKKTDYLSSLGAKIYIGHSAENITCEIDKAVITSAIAENNPEVAKCKALNIPILHRSNALQQIIKNFKVIAIAGSHGKSTTAGIVYYALKTLGITCGIINGAETIETSSSIDFDINYEYMVIEADESDASFLNYTPAASLITNISVEHLEHYASEKNIEKAFLNFAALNCDIVLFSEYDNICKALYRQCKNPEKHILKKTIRLTDNIITFQYKNRVFQAISSLKGFHNAINICQGAVLIDNILNKNAPKISFQAILEACASYKGTSRRLEHILSHKNIELYDDYAHHPKEVSAGLNAISGKKIIIFEPHLYSRLLDHKDEFLDIFLDKQYNIEKIFVAPVCHARGKILQEINSEIFANLLNKRQKGLAAAPALNDIPGELVQCLQQISFEKITVILMGVEIYKILPDIKNLILKL